MSCRKNTSKPVKPQRKTSIFPGRTGAKNACPLAARGGFLQRALGDMRKVAWDRGPVRLGSFAREDGAQVPLWHDSEVAAIAFAIENIIAMRLSGKTQDMSVDQVDVGPSPHPLGGKKCQECGARAVIKKDGCEYCTACGFVGACG